MAKFKITCNDDNLNQHEIYYDNMTNDFFNSDMDKLNVSAFKKKTEIKELNKISKSNPGKKSNSLKRIRISMGFGCNYDCSYCSQSFSRHKIKEKTVKELTEFIENLSKIYDGGIDGLGTGTKFEFWGGEPLVYWKTFKFLAEKIKEKYPNGVLGVITNGSLLTKEKTDWLFDMGFSVGMSHDGPAHKKVRGPDPFDDEEQKKEIMYFIKKFIEVDRVSLNPVFCKQSVSRKTVMEYFDHVLESEGITKKIPIGEGAFIDMYDDASEEMTLHTEEESIKYRLIFQHELLTSEVPNRYNIVLNKLNGFADRVKNNIDNRNLGQKCSMDSEEHIAVDLHGNVITCQNISANTSAPNGESNKIGNISDYENVKLNTSTHWSNRYTCPNCPVVALCQGSCMFNEGDYFALSCNTSYSDNVVLFAYAIRSMFNLHPFLIEMVESTEGCEHVLQRYRQVLWGSDEWDLENGATNLIKTKKFFPIKVLK